MKSTLLGDLAELLRVYRGGKFRGGESRAAAAVVLGAQVVAGGRPSRTLRVRTLFAAKLYSEGAVRIVIPTGGVGEHPPSEAAVMSEVLRNAGVPDEAILAEDRGLTTLDSARRVSALAHTRNIKDVLIVTDPLHCIRAVSMFEEAGLSATAAPVYDSPMWTSSSPRRGQFVRETGAIVWYRARSHPLVAGRRHGRKRPRQRSSKK